MDAPRVGVVGLGGMGTRHATNARNAGAAVVAGSDVVSETRDRFGEEFDAATYDHHDAMLAAHDLDAVVVTTPNAHHAAPTIAALERGLAVLCEKPLADTLAAAERIAAIARESAGWLMAGFHERFSPAGEILAARRRAGRFGDVSHVEGWYVRRRGIPGVGSWFTRPDLSGGGALIDLGPHLIDFALYAAGFPTPVEVTGTIRSEFGAREDYADPDDWAAEWSGDGVTFDVEDSASAFVRCADGTTLSLETAWASNRPDRKEVLVRGTDAGAQCVIGGDDLTIYGAGVEGTDHYSDETIQGSLEPSGWAGEMAAFLEAVEAGTAPARNTVDQALTVQRVLDGIYRSAERGRAVSVDATTDD